MFNTVDTPATQFDTNRWAAEELALQLGWLRECPFHGEPFKDAGASDAGAASMQTSRVAPPDCTGDLYRLAAQLSRTYAECCPVCAYESALPE